MLPALLLPESIYSHVEHIYEHVYADITHIQITLEESRCFFVGRYTMSDRTDSQYVHELQNRVDMLEDMLSDMTKRLAIIEGGAASPDAKSMSPSAFLCYMFYV